MKNRHKKITKTFMAEFNIIIDRAIKLLPEGNLRNLSPFVQSGFFWKIWNLKIPYKNQKFENRYIKILKYLCQNLIL